MAKYTQVRADTFQTIQINAGIVLSAFTPATGSYNREDIIGATTGGNNFASNPTYSDYFADVDNVPENTKEGKRIDFYDPALSMNFVTVDTPLGKKLIAAADIDGDDNTHIIPRNYLKDEDFGDIWLVGDYTDKNGASNGGFVAIHVKNALNTGGFQFQSTKNGKGQFSADFHGHYTIENIDDVPFEVYIKAGKSESSIYISHNPLDQEVDIGDTASFGCRCDKTDAAESINPSYQWQKQAVGEGGYTDISGATSPVLRVSDVTAAMNGDKYRCKCINGEDVIISNSATLTVRTGA